MKKLLAAVVVGSAIGMVTAATRGWTGGSGSVEDPAKWGGTLPGIGDTASVTATGDDVLTYPTTKPHTNFYAVSAKAPDGKTLTFSGVESSVVTPSAETGTYNKEPYKLYSDSEQIFDLEAYWGESDKQTATGPFTFSNFSYRVIGSSTEPAIHFDRGTYVFDPADSKTRKHWFFPKVTADSRKYSINYHAGSSVSLAGILYGVNPMDAVLRFDGGVHCQRKAAAWDSNNFSYNNGATDKEGRKSRLEVVGAGTKFTLESPSTVGDNGFPNREFTFLAADGGELAFGDSITANNAGTHVFMATNAGVLSVYGSSFATGGSGNARIVVRDSTFHTTGGTTVFGGSTATGAATAGFTNSTVSVDNRWNVCGAADLAMKGGRLESIWDGPIYAQGGTFGIEDAAVSAKGSWVVDGGVMTLKDACGSISNVVVGYTADKTGSELVLDGGAITNRGLFSVGYKGSGTISITGGKHVFGATKTTKSEGGLVGEYTCNGVGENGNGTLNVSGADTEVFFDVDHEIYFGNSAGSVGNLNVSGGSLTIGKAGFSSMAQFFASQDAAKAVVRITGGATVVRASLTVPRGTFDYLQSGGTFTTGGISLGGFGKAGAGGSPMSFRMTGGTATVDGSFIVTQYDTYRGSVTLDGGTLAVCQLAGGNGCAWNGQTGTAVFSANGGTLKALRKSEGYAPFLRRFDTATLGADGLVIDTDYDITVEQPFVAAEGVTGKLIKRGAGTLTLTGALSDEIEIVVEEGLVDFGTSGTIAALTLGSETSAGGIALGEGIELNVKGDVTVVHDASPQDIFFVKDPQTGVSTAVVDDSPAESLEIRLDEGTSNATADVVFRGADTLTAIVAKDAKLFLDGRYARGAFVKQGGGAATLTGSDNTFLGGVTLVEGLLSATTLSGLGFDFATSPDFVQRGGTLELADGGDFPAAVTVDAASKTAAVVVKNDVDVTVKKPFTLTNGALFKRGAGTLRFETPATLAVDNGVDPISRTVQSFDDNGTVPTTGYAGFNVVEGEVVLANATYAIDRCGYVGLRTAQAPAAKPTLTFTNATVSLNGGGSYMFFVGSCVTATDPGQEFALNIIDSRVTGNTPLCVGGYSGCASTSPNSRVDVVMRNSTITAGYGVWLNENTSGGKTYWTIDNSRFYGKQASRSLGYSALEFVNGSVYASSSALDGAPLPEVRNEGSADGGYLRFNEGTDAYIDKLGGQGGFFTIKLYFNGGVWHPGPCPMLRWAEGYNPARTQVVLEEKGVVLPIASGTCRNTIRLEGEGGLVKTGAGELFFDTRSTWDTWTDTATPREQKLTAALGGIDTWRFTGEAEVREGTLSVAAGAAVGAVKACVAEGATFELGEDCVLEGAVLRGAGTVTGGTLRNATVGTGDETLTIASAVDGRLWLDFGRTEDDPLPYPQRAVVAKWSGTKPDVSSWRVKGLGTRGVKGVCTALDDGTVVADINRFGMLLIVR